MKSLTPRIRREDTPFTKDQEKWIAQRHLFYSPQQLRRLFIRTFMIGNPSAHRLAPHRKAFERITIRFDKTGGVTGQGKTKEQRTTVSTEKNICRVENFFSENEKASLRDAADELDMSMSTIWTILRQSLKWKAYKPAVLSFLLEKFGGRVISRRSEIIWPRYSPDLNVLDYLFWSFVMQQVRRVKPTTIDELKATVEEVAASVPVDLIRKAVANVRKRCSACILAGGDHFESFLKSL